MKFVSMSRMTKNCLCGSWIHHDLRGFEHILYCHCSLPFDTVFSLNYLIYSTLYSEYCSQSHSSTIIIYPITTLINLYLSKHTHTHTHT